MKYITIKASYAKEYLPMDIETFFKTATMADIDNVEACIGGAIMASMVTVSRKHDGELEITVIDPAYAISPDGQPDATDWYMAIRKAKSQPVQPGLVANLYAQRS